MPQPSRDRRSHKALRSPEEEAPRWHWPLPQDLRQALGDGKLASLTNPSLLLQRYVPYPISSDVQWGWDIGKKNFKKLVWEQIATRINELYIGESGDNEFFKALLKRQKATLEALEAQGYEIQTLRVQVKWRLVVGLGLPSPLETGITLQHLYGFPYLPGSAIKGVTRAWRLQKIAAELGIPRLNAWEIKDWGKGKTPWSLLEELLMSPIPKEGEPPEENLSKNIGTQLAKLKEVLNDKASFFREHGYLQEHGPPILQVTNPTEFMQNYIHSFSGAFGSLEAQGEIVFFDAYPEALVVDTEEGKKSILELDVMNPHYGEYYTGSEPPADWLSPVPVLFLVVRKGTVFNVSLAWRHLRKAHGVSGRELLAEVAGWTKNALQELGIGAKTRAGYGELGQPTSATTQTPAEGTGRANGPLAQLETSIGRWKPSEMGILSQLIQNIAQVDAVELRRQLAHQLHRKLREAGMWTKKNQGAPWYRAVERLLEASANATT